MEVDGIFLDRDGVINNVIMRAGLVSSPRCFAEFELAPGFVDFYNAISSSKRSIRKFVISNQPDLSRKLLAQEELDRMTAALTSRFAFDEVLYCTHDDIHACACRKPRAGMVEHLLHKFNLERTRCLLIGDNKKDILCGQAAGLATILLRRSYNRQIDCKPEFIVDELREVLSIIDFGHSSV